MWCVCAQLYTDQSKKIFDHFICFWKWFLSLFEFMFSAYFIFQQTCSVLKNRCLSFLRLISRLARDSRKFLRLISRLISWLASHATQVTSSSRSFRDSSRDKLMTHKNFRDSLRNSLSCETPRNSFLKGFSWETCFKPLTFSFKPFFQYFYIKTQSIWMVFSFLNISKVILNSFHCFGFLNYVLESFVLLVKIFIIGVGKF